jgi:hypothetical protein
LKEIKELIQFEGNWAKMSLLFHKNSIYSNNLSPEPCHSFTF